MNRRCTLCRRFVAPSFQIEGARQCARVGCTLPLFPIDRRDTPVTELPEPSENRTTSTPPPKS